MDNVNHPQHYLQLEGIEVVDITEQFDFLLGNVLKYIMRHEHKGNPLEDLKKAQFYLNRKIRNLESDLEDNTTYQCVGRGYSRSEIHAT